LGFKLLDAASEAGFGEDALPAPIGTALFAK